MVWVHHLKIRAFIAFIIDEIIWHSMWVVLNGEKWAARERIRMRFDKWLLRSENEISIKSFSMSAIINLSGIHDCSSLSRLMRSPPLTLLWQFYLWWMVSCWLFLCFRQCRRRFTFFSVMLHKAQRSWWWTGFASLFGFLLLFFIISEEHCWRAAGLLKVWLALGKLQEISLNFSAQQYWRVEVCSQFLNWNFSLFNDDVVCNYGSELQSLRLSWWGCRCGREKFAIKLQGSLDAAGIVANTNFPHLHQIHRKSLLIGLVDKATIVLVCCPWSQSQ